MKHNLAGRTVGELVSRPAPSHDLDFSFFCSINRLRLGWTALGDVEPAAVDPKSCRKGQMTAEQSAAASQNGNSQDQASDGQASKAMHTRTPSFLELQG